MKSSFIISNDLLVLILNNVEDIYIIEVKFHFSIHTVGNSFWLSISIKLYRYDIIIIPLVENNSSQSAYLPTVSSI